MAALTLATYDIDVLLLDKREGNGKVSRALVASVRTLELLRRFGFEDAVRATAVDVVPCAWITDDLRSREGRRQPLGYPVGADAAKVSPTAPLWAPQNLWEPRLLERLGTLPQVGVRLRCETESVSLLDDGALVTFVDAMTHHREQVRTRYVIAADGAHSVLRRALGIGMDGPDDLAEVDRVEFGADVEAAVGPLVCGLNVITNPEVGGVLAPRDNNGRWGITRDIAGPTPRLAEMGAVQLKDYVQRLLGVEGMDVEIEGVRTFRFAAQLAASFRAGPVFLAGDAAHRVTPRGGTGMNMAIQDGFDLGWKLGLVLSGLASADLLDSYERERRLIAAHNVERSATPVGAVQTAEEALPWDLDGRIAHHWVAPKISTIDLPGPGLTLLLGPSAKRLVGASDTIDVHVLGRGVCEALGLPLAGGVLLRPDGKPVRRWTALDTGLDPWEQLTVATRTLPQGQT